MNHFISRYIIITICALLFSSCTTALFNPYDCIKGTQIAIKMDETGKKQWCELPKDKGGPAVYGSYSHWNKEGRLIDYREYKLGKLSGEVLKFYPNPDKHMGHEIPKVQITGTFENNLPNGAAPVADLHPEAKRFR